MSGKKVEPTAGEWRVEYIAPTQPEHKFEPRCAIVAYSTEYDRDVRLADIPDPDSEQLANAQLMASAPYLLKACERALQLRALESSILSGKYDVVEVRRFRDEAREIEDEIRVAISKARATR